MHLRFVALEELAPGPAWAAHYARVAPLFERWYFGEGDARRPTYLACEQALSAHMPEIVPLWRGLVDLAGGGDRAARMMSLYRPPAFMAGCSQLLWTRGEPALIRNYDYQPALCEGLFLRSAWSGRGVIASIDSLWGALDGMNSDGVAVCLAFGGRQIVGDGFGIPLILRYVLETCADTAAAIAALRRLPCHMCYTVGVIDRSGAAATVFLNPDRPAEVVADAAATNHQGRVEWPEHAALSRSVERRAALERIVDDPRETLESACARFVAAPLRTSDEARAFATLYTAIYRPRSGALEVRWPTARWVLAHDHFPDQSAVIPL